MRKFHSFLVPLLLTLTGCLIGNYDEALKKYATQYATEVELSQKYLSQLRAHDFAEIEQHVDPSLKSGSLHDNLEKVASYIPSGEPTDVKLIGVYRNEILNAENMSTTQVDYEYDFSGKWYQGDVILKGEKPNLSILGLSVTALVGPLDEINRFTFQGKEPINYIILALTCIIPIFIIFALIVCIRTPIQKRKWLWLLFIIFGVIGGTLNWTEGSVIFNPISLRLLGAGFYSSGPYSPLFLQFSLPLGAIIFLLGRKRWRAKSPPTIPANSL
jgi:hypothetical protein